MFHPYPESYETVTHNLWRARAALRFICGLCDAFPPDRSRVEIDTEDMSFTLDLVLAELGNAEKVLGQVVLDSRAQVEADHAD